jgi:hypothetical protein
MKELEHPDPDIFRMCKLYLSRLVRHVAPDFAVPGDDWFHLGLVWLTASCEQIFQTLQPSRKKDTSQERPSSARGK